MLSCVCNGETTFFVGCKYYGVIGILFLYFCSTSTKQCSDIYFEKKIAILLVLVFSPLEMTEILVLRTKILLIKLSSQLFE